jgi:hypothetical protein
MSYLCYPSVSGLGKARKRTTPQERVAALKEKAESLKKKKKKSTKETPITEPTEPIEVKKPNYLLYAGLGVGVLALFGGLKFLGKKKK